MHGIDILEEQLITNPYTIIGDNLYPIVIVKVKNTSNSTKKVSLEANFYSDGNLLGSDQASFVTLSPGDEAFLHEHSVISTLDTAKKLYYDISIGIQRTENRMGKNKQTLQMESVKDLLDNLPQDKLKYGHVSDDIIFKILNTEGKEIFHSRLLKYLIENNWNSFIKFLESDNLDKSKAVNELQISQCEFLCTALQDCPESKTGRIDLYFETTSRIVAIEVKWHAGEQPTQLLRYYRYLKEQKQNKQFTLIFLTPTGRPADNINCINSEKKCSIQIQATDHKELSYKNLSENWLRNLEGTDKNKNGLISQYREILIKETKNMTNASVILELLQNAENAKTYAAACALADSMDYVKETIRSAYFNALD